MPDDEEFDSDSKDSEKEDIYNEEGMEELEEDDEISPEEEGFMKGYKDAETKKKKKKKPGDDEVVDVEGEEAEPKEEGSEDDVKEMASESEDEE